MEMLPEGLKAEEVVVVGKAPTVDVGSSSTGVTLNQDFVSRLALTPPGAQGRGVALVRERWPRWPRARTSDAYGVSIAGTTSPENAFVVDGVAVNDPAFGILGTPLSSEFVKEMAHHHRRLHAGVRQGHRRHLRRRDQERRQRVPRRRLVQHHARRARRPAHPGPLGRVHDHVNPTLSSLRDFGADIGGPIIKDKLWFYAGFQLAFSNFNLNRSISQFNYTCDKTNNPSCAANGAMMQVVDPNTGFPSTTPVSSRTYIAAQKQPSTSAS